MLKDFDSTVDENSTKNKIFMAAAKLFAKKGYNGVSMREISEMTGVSKPTIYYYFGNKEGIYSALAQAGLQHGLNHIREIMNQQLSIKQKLIELIKIRFHQAVQFPEFAKFFLLLFTAAEKMPFLKDFIAEADHRRQVIVNMIQEGIDRKEFGPAVDPNIASEIFIGTSSYFILRQINGDEQILSDELAEKIVEFLFRGLNE